MISQGIFVHILITCISGGTKMHLASSRGCWCPQQTPQNLQQGPSNTGVLSGCSGGSLLHRTPHVLPPGCVCTQGLSLQPPHPSSEDLVHSSGFSLRTIQPCCFDFVTGQTPCPSRINKIAWLMICELRLNAIYCRNSSL